MSLNQGLGLPFGIQVVNPVAVDSWVGPYQSIAEANASVPAGVRYIGVTSGITVGRTVVILYNGIPTDYWWYGGIADGNLVIKNYSSTGGTSTNYTAGDNLVLSGNTFIVTGLTPLNYYQGVSGISINGNQISYIGTTGINLSANTFYVSTGGVGYRSSNIIENLSDATIALDINSTTKGLMIPKLTTATRDSLTSVPTGLLQFNTTNNSFEFYDSIRWKNTSYLFPDSTSSNQYDGVSLKNQVNVKFTGRITVTNGSSSVTGVGTLFTTELTGKGNLWVFDGATWYNCRFTNAGITSNTSLLLTNIITLADYYAGTNRTFQTPIAPNFTGTTGTYEYYQTLSFSQGYLSVSLGNQNRVNSNYTLVNGLSNVANGTSNGGLISGDNNYSSGYGFILGQQNVTTGFGAIALGFNAFASGSFSFAGGHGNNLGSDPALYKRIISSAAYAFNWSTNDASQTVGHGALAISSAILGGQNHNIPSDSPRSIILGGNAIKARATTPDLAYVPSLNIVNNPVNSIGSSFNLLGRSSSTGNTGDIITVLLDPNTLSITSNGLTYVGPSGTTYYEGNGIQITGNTISFTGQTNYVDLSSNQSNINGNKTFNGVTTVTNNLKIYKTFTTDSIEGTGVGRTYYLDPNFNFEFLACQAWVRNNFTYTGLSGISVSNNVISYTGGTGVNISSQNQQIIFNNNGFISGDTSFKYDGINKRLNFGNGNVITGSTAIAIGQNNIAGGNYSQAFGFQTKALGVYSHAEGFNTQASSNYSHAEGSNAIANGVVSHAEGNQTIANGDYSHAEGYQTITSITSQASHAEGQGSQALAQASHAEGLYTIANGIGSHAEGGYLTAYGQYSHAGGTYANAYGFSSFIHTFSNNTFPSYAYANYSAILGGGIAGYAQIMPSGNTGSVLLGNSTFTVPTGYTYTTFVKNLYALNYDKPIIIRNSGGTESYISVDNNNQLNFNGVPISTGGTGNVYTAGNGINISGNVISYTGSTNSSLGYLVTDKFIYLSGNPIFTTTNNIGVLVAVEQRGVDLIPGDQFTVTQPSTVQILTGNTAVDINDTFVIKYFTSTGTTIQQNITIYSGGTVDNYYTTSVSYTVLPTDCYIECTTGLSITLITTGIQAGKKYRVKNTSTGTVTVTPTSGTIDNVANKVISTQNDAFDFVFNGTDYKIY